MTNNKDNYQTQSLLVAATLLCFGIPLGSTTRELNGKSTFSFARTANLNELLESFWKRVLSVEPNVFWESIKFVKNLVHDSMQIPGREVNADGNTNGELFNETQQGRVAKQGEEVSKMAKKA